MNIVIIGLGNIGKRHLQAVLKCDLPINIYCVDANEHALDNFEDNIDGVILGTSVDIVPSEIDVAIIATSSGVRRKVFDELISKARVRYIIFEKVLFDRIEDYEYVDKRLKEFGIKAWVNCGRRYQPMWQYLKDELKKVDSFEFHLSGGNWGLGCNSIHILDAIAFVSNSIPQIKGINLENNFVDSKRSGYKEIYGAIFGVADRCNNFSITCYDKSVSMEYSIITNKDKYYIDETQNKVVYTNSEGVSTNLEFESFYVSQLSTIIVSDLLMEGSCDLPSFSESKSIHMDLFGYLLPYFSERGIEKGLCPIT